MADPSGEVSAQVEPKPRAIYHGRVAYWKGREWVTPPTACRMLDVTDWTLRDWRVKKFGPVAAYHTLWGFTWRYDLQSIYDFILRQALNPNRRG